MAAKTVHLHLIRHGYSCANAVKATNNIPVWNKVAHHLYKDPDLTDFSAAKVAEAAAANPTPRFDLVVTSPLIRAIKTGIIYAQRSNLTKVHSTPYLNELTDYILFDKVGLNKDNNAEVPQLQIQYIKADPRYKNVDVDASARSTVNAIRVQASGVDENYARLVDYVLKLSCGLSRDEVHVAVVGHSHYFKKLVEGLEHTPNGTELAVHTLTVDLPACARGGKDNQFVLKSSEWSALKKELKTSGSEGCARRWALDSST